MAGPIERTILIHAPPSVIWKALTEPELMKRWMGEPEMKIEVITSWEVGQPITIRGDHHGKFENKGTVLAYKPFESLTYDHLSSVSRLPDIPENHTIIEFCLLPVGDRTQLTLTLSNFPTESIFKHVDFYWRGTIGLLKKFVEEIPKG